MSSYSKIAIENGDYLDMYDYVIVTHIPAFYKVNLYEELSKHLNIYVVFIAETTSEVRADGFTSLSNLSFDHTCINRGNFQDRWFLTSLLGLRKVLSPLKYKKLMLAGWDLPEFWYLAFTHKQKYIAMVLESTIRESSTTGLKRFIKTLFLSRISKVFASGKEHISLLEQLGFKREVRVTNGVGLINKPERVKKQGRYAKRFLFIGRLSTVKNLDFLVDVFNGLPDAHLTIIGDGPLIKALQEKSMENILYMNKIANHALGEQFLNHDVLILASLSEPWGLVIEEALYHGLPVIVSRNCGAAELVKHGENGFIFNPLDASELKDIISSINIESYAALLKGVEVNDIQVKDAKQIGSYL